MDCVTCGMVIPPKRLQVLPETKTCVKCSNVQAVVGITVWDERSPSMVIVNPAEAEAYWRHERSDGRLERL